jgi:hypothetical protein
MPYQQHHMIKVPAERGAQLKRLAAARGTTMVAVISEWINREIAAGNLPDTVPGFDVAVVKSHGGKAHVALTIGTYPCKPLTADDANAVADALTAAVERGAGTLNCDLADWIGVTIDRIGVGVTIEATRWPSGESVRKVVSRAIAADLARLLRIAAKKVA